VYVVSVYCVGERPYSCSDPDCDRTFSDVTNLKRHEMTHSADRPFKVSDTHHHTRQHDTTGTKRNGIINARCTCVYARGIGY
jgi:uncharacterized Zn-finger protein